MQIDTQNKTRISKTKSNWISIHWIKQIKSLTACWQNKDQTFDGAYSSRIVDDEEDEKEPYARWWSLFAPVFFFTWIAEEKMIADR